MGTLTVAEATVDTHFGKIEVSLKRKGKKIQVALSVPEGAIAEVPISQGRMKRLEAGEHSLVIPVR